MARPLADWQARVVGERTDLERRTNRLTAFLSSPIAKGLPPAEQDLLRRQLQVMGQYRQILTERIAAFS